MLATPHLGYVTQANYRRYYTDAVEDIYTFDAGEPLRVMTSGTTRSRSAGAP